MKHVSLFLVLIIMLLSCNETEFEQQVPIVENELPATESNAMTVSDAQNIFHKNYNADFISNQVQLLSSDNEDECFSSVPYWYLSQQVQLTNGNTILSVPLSIPNKSNRDGRGAQLLFFEDSSCEFPYIFMWYEGDSDIKSDDRRLNLSNEDFKGKIYLHNYCNDEIAAFKIDQGEFIDVVELDNDEFECDDVVYKCPNCYNGWKKKKGLFKAIGDWLSNLFSGAGDPNSIRIIITYVYSGLGNLDFPEIDSDSGSGGITHPTIEDIFDDPIFNGEGLTVHQTLTSIIAENNFNLCPGELHDILYECMKDNFESTLSTGGAGFGSGVGSNVQFDMDNYIRTLSDPAIVEECLSSADVTVLEEDISEEGVEVICAIKQFFPDEHVNEIHNIIINNCGPTGGFACKLAQLYCLDRLRDFKERYGVEMSYTELEEIAGGACRASDEEFDDEVVKILFEENYPTFYEIYDLLGDHTNEEKLNFIFGEAPDLSEFYADPPDCEGCTSSEAETVREAELKAIEMLDCILEKFESYNGVWPLDIVNSMEQHFGMNTLDVASYVDAVFKYLRYHPFDRSYEAQNTNEGYCGSTTLAWTYPLTQVTSVKLCRPNYWNSSSLEQASTLIHEWTHLNVGTNDWAYEWESEYDELNTLTSLTNADSYTAFIKELCP